LLFSVADPANMTATINHDGFNTSLSRSMSESQARFSITSDNMHELNMSFMKDKIQTSDPAKLKRQIRNVRPAVSKPYNDQVV